MRSLWVYFSAISLLYISACTRQDEINVYHEPKLMEIPKGFPPIVFPSDNAYTPERWVLGKKLFHDKALSLDYTVSCASCHKASLAFSDEIAFSIGAHNLLGKSNAPTLTNMAYHPYFTRAGGVPTLEMQILVPIQEHNEFDFNIVEISKRLEKDTLYNQMANKAYARNIDPYVITRAIANYERSLVSGNSDYDKYQNGQEKTLSAIQIKGMNLFFSEKTNCSTCHAGIQFTDFSFKNNGLYETYADSGRIRLTGLEKDRAVFKVPTLRNIALTAPYMHDGSIKTLSEVIEHYNTGGKNHKNKSPLIKPLLLTKAEKEAIEAFLLTLTDKQFVTNKHFK